MLKGTLYTTYFAKHKQAIGFKIGITRFKPKWLDLEKERIYNLESLSPSTELLKNYKNNNCYWDTYKKLFHDEMENREDMKFSLNKIKEVLDSGKDITLICYEKDRNICHRSLIGDYFSNLGYKVEEIE